MRNLICVKKERLGEVTRQKVCPLGFCLIFVMFLCADADLTELLLVTFSSCL